MNDLINKAQATFDYDLAHQVLDPHVAVVTEYEGTPHYDGDIIIDEVKPDGTLCVSAGYGWEHASHWFDLMPQYDDNGVVTAYKLLAYGKI